MVVLHFKYVEIKKIKIILIIYNNLTIKEIIVNKIHYETKLQFFQLRKSVQEFKTCAENYQKLYESAFDADPESLENIRAYPFFLILVIDF